MISDPTLLVVDDEQVYCDGCERIFSRQGFRVEGSNDATEALRLATENDYSAILLDVKMPNMDGIRFLEHLRAAKPDTPVILMTGYPSIQNAASALRLGASDYVTKPFTPEQITSAVQGLVHPNSSSDLKTETESLDAEPSRLMFHGRGWAFLSDHGAARVGGIVPRRESHGVELQLPRVGDIVHQGLPLFSVCDHDATATMIASPLTGMVVEVNAALEENPELLWTHPCGLGWVARIAPTRLESEETRLRTRGIVAVTANQDFLEFYRDKLSRFGCDVHNAGPDDTDALLDSARTTGVVLFDAASCGSAGPAVVANILEELPKTKVIVVAPTGEPLQEAYRACRLFYYAVPPLEDREILDIVDSCYCPPTRSKATPAPSSQNLPISALHVNLGEDQRVTLLAPNGLLQREVGLGLALRNGLLGRLLPLETGFGALELTPIRLLRELEESGRVIALTTSDTDRLPGTLTTYQHGSLAAFVGIDVENVTVLAVQPMPGAPDMSTLDSATVETLADHIIEEMLG